MRRFRLRWRLCIGAGLLLGSLGASLPTQADPLPDRVTFHYIPDNQGQILLTVLVDGTEHATMMVDTGTTDSTLSDTLVAKLGLTPAPAIRLDGRPVTLNGHTLQGVIVPMLKIGPLQFAHSQYTVLNTLTMSAGSKVPFDGLLGLNALRTLPILMDFQTHQITFFFHSPVTAEELQSVGMADAVAVPLTDKVGGIPMPEVQMTSGAHRVTEPMLLDTGSFPTILSQQAARKLKLTTLGIHTMNFPAGPVPTIIARLGQLGLGTGASPLPDLTVLALSGAALPSVPPHVGLDVLTQYQVLLDISAKTMYLKPVPAVSNPAPVSRG